ncbi:hypothetical protein PCYB_008300 [Plasmodium cynomolgi strain B]|uniref:CYIR protein n=1 Tax=Plasmodium cynomolgi (strain B) TaxID=1120755 RepID=K6UFG9_PLACD|nr:hypothetical protein PCYB_008300 [Plasmodium cynomolgi strain B]GAB70081.1 hypothetical protein PCYB_008300 [Plasmodium cynomolgi strain B]
MAFKCPEVDEKNSKSNVFKLKCADKIFKPFLNHFSHFDKLDDKCLDHINKIKDPILKYISVYLVQYYKDGYEYYKDSEKKERDAACQYLKLWLHEQKDLFTYGGMCTIKLWLWNNHIRTLWTLLEEDSYHLYREYDTMHEWCKYYGYQYTKYPPGITLHNCEESISKELHSEDPLQKTIRTDCECSDYDFAVSSKITGNTPDINPTKKIAVTSGLTSVGTAGALLLLYKVINKQ